MALRVLLIGASGTLGRAIDAEIGARHTIVRANSRSGDVKIDITDVASIEKALADVGQVDAVITAVGNVTFAPLAEIQAASLATSTYALGLESKLMGQVNVALAARKHVRDRGSITLTSGILTHEPIVAGTSASMVNGAIDAFVRAAAIELPRGLRINAVSPTVFTESMDAYGPFFRGFESVPVARAALAFAKSVEGAQTGRVYQVL